MLKKLSPFVDGSEMARRWNGDERSRHSCLQAVNRAFRDEKRKQPEAPVGLQAASKISGEPTNEASAELNLFELCLARRRKTKSSRTRVKPERNRGAAIAASTSPKGENNGRNNK